MFQLSARFSTPSAIGYDYQYSLYSALQSVISVDAPEFFDMIHNSRGSPLYNMSSLIPLQFDGEPLWLNSRLFVLIFNSTSGEFITALKKSLPPGKTLRLNDGTLTLQSSLVEEINIPHAPSYPEMKSMGPIVISNHGKYYRYEDPEFEKELIASLKRKADRVTGKENAVRGVRVLTGQRKLYHVKDIPVPASIVRFILDADEDVIRTALVFGVGSKPQMGFGMVKLVD